MSQIFTLEEIFGVPIKAILDADYMAARQAAEYISEFGFEQYKPQLQANPNLGCTDTANKLENLGTVRESSFLYNQVNSKGFIEPRVMRVPTLSLIPLPLLHVDNADFDYSVRILESDKDGKTQATLTTQKGANANSSNPHLEANINVKVKVVQSDLPAGITNLMALMGSNVINKTAHNLYVDSEVLPIKIGSNSAVMSMHMKNAITNCGLPKELVTVTYDESVGFTVNSDKRKWESGTVMLTNEQGAINIVIGTKNVKGIKPGSVHRIKFTDSCGESCYTDLYFE